MSEPLHDPEPWSVIPYRPGDKWVTIPEPAIRVDYDDVPEGVGPANAERVVACVNAMEDVADPARLREALVKATRAFEQGGVDWMGELGDILRAAGL